MIILIMIIVVIVVAVVVIFVIIDIYFFCYRKHFLIVYIALSKDEGNWENSR